VASGQADFALLGSDKYGELTCRQKFCYEPVGKLACRFVLALPRDFVVGDEEKLIVATTYPKALQTFLGESSIEADLGPVRSGKTEAAIAQGIATAIFDICETGASLDANGLRILAEAEPLELGGLWLREGVS